MVLVDFSNLVWACWYGAESNYLEFVLSKVEGFQDLFKTPRSGIVLAKDSRAQWKYDLYPGYKGKRKPVDFDPRPDAESLLKQKGWRFAYSPGFEADDVIASLIPEDLDCVVVSSDKDLWQLIAPHVRVWDPVKRDYVDRPKIEKSFGLEDPKQIRLHKALWGDTSDNLPNLAPRMQRYLLPIVRSTDGSLENFTELLLVASEAGVLSNRCRALLARNYNEIKLNWELAGLKKCKVEWEP